jgi:addiction module RelE/StbE family toxin
MKVRYTDAALRDLSEAVSYLLEHNPSSAAGLADQVHAAVARLLDHPYLAEETQMPGVRRAYIRRYRYSLFYAVEGEEVIVLHIRHAARQWPWEE